MIKLPRTSQRLFMSAGLLLAMQLSFANEGNHPANPPSHEEIVAGLAQQTLTIDELRSMGLDVFSTPFNTHDGMGDGAYDANESEPRLPGQRPTLQGNGLILRLNGLDAQSCNECHTIVSNKSRPPELGIGGVGGMVQNAIILPTVIDVADSTDDRTQPVAGHDPDMPMVPDGVADFNGRFANPPFLFGGGGVEMLAKEMTIDLQRKLRYARAAAPGSEFRLRTHGVDFGTLVRRADGTVDLSGVEGLGFVDNDHRAAEDVLVVRPFGRKGENFSMRDFDRGAMMFHFGIQPVEVVGQDVDDDRDGVVNEVTVGEMTALHMFDVNNPPPYQEALNRDERAGRALFASIGCADCHRPQIRTRSTRLPMAFPEVASDPYANVYAYVNLVRVGFSPSDHGGVVVPLYSDLKRHKMGAALAETFEGGEIANDEFITARLWGIADTAPYLHDGRATTLREAIEYHGGEAEVARDGFLGLSSEQQSQLLAFLDQLRTPIKPNQDLLTTRTGK
ncbi:MAG: thiol oxidoreductase [Lysobacteraceae bacterium]|nr:MAG: thiol oxidoreductase [Xanthomonadaceae bacterium]